MVDRVKVVPITVGGAFCYAIQGGDGRYLLGENRRDVRRKSVLLGVTLESDCIVSFVTDKNLASRWYDAQKASDFADGHPKLELIREE